MRSDDGGRGETPSRRLPQTFSGTGDPVGQNPFLKDDPRHGVWADATREAEEEVARITSAVLQKGAVASDGLELVYAVVDASAAKFDAWARRAIKVVWSDDAVTAFDAWLANYANAWIEAIVQYYRSAPPSVLADIVTRLRNLFGGRAKHWMAEARRYRAQQERRRIETSATPPKTADVCSWTDVKIEFTSEEQVQVTVKGKMLSAQNYAELGFENRRSKKPNKAWEALLLLAEAHGDWKAEFEKRRHFEKRIQEIRPLLRQYLQRQGYIAPSDDPLPCRKGRYTVAFAIGTRPSF